jgi:ATP-dependent RNA helicase DeaD
MNKFNQIGVNPTILKSILELGFENPTEIQEQTIPHILNSDQDLVALAQTGTGKTGAFGIPLVQRVDTSSKKTQVLILCPTRELCLQIHKDLYTYAKYEKNLQVVAVYGGAPISTQIRDLKRGAQIVVGTPGRVQDILNRKVLNISEIEWLVLDEADEMLNMGFKEEIDNILVTAPKSKTTLLFSATMPREIAKITKQYMKDPFEISVGTKNSSSKNIKHVYYKVHEQDRYEGLRRILDFEPDMYGIVFCRTKNETQDVASKLMQDGYPAEPIHGDLSQAQRTKAMNRLRERRIQLLVATDVAARGIDIKDLTHVINYNLPDSLETYTHRSGRTGRANSSGISIVIINMREKRYLQNIERRVGIQFEKRLIPAGVDIVNKKMAFILDALEKAEINPEAEILIESMKITDYKLLATKLLNQYINESISKYKNSRDINATGDQRGSRPERDRGDRNRGNQRGSRPDRRSGSDNRNTDRRPERKNTDNITFISVEIGIGKKDGLGKKELFQLINSERSLRGAEIGHISIEKESTNFEIDQRLAQQVQKFLPNGKFKGKTFSVNVD